MRARRKITTISFDVDGTLVTPAFADMVWLEALPQMVSESWGIPLEDAKKKLFSDYESIGPQQPEWYDICYWVKRYKLDVNPKAFVLQYKAAVTPYPEVSDVLESLRKRYDLIVISNSSRLFLEVSTEGFKHYFRHIFSTLSDFERMKDRDSYLLACKEAGIAPSEVVHVGDNFELDYVRAKRAGMRSFFLDRCGRQRGRFFVRDLREFAARVTSSYPSYR